MTVRQHLQKTISLAIPVTIGQLGHIMVNVADSIMVGKLGVIPLAAATFASSIYVVLLLFGIGVSYAITPMTASTSPENKPVLLKIIQNGLILNLVLGVILSEIGWGLSHFLGHFGQEQEVAQAAVNYLRIISFSMLPLMVFQSFRQFAEGQSDTITPMVISILSNLLNVGLNYLLIHGKWGFPQLGLDGAAYASLIARFLMAFLMIASTYKLWKGFVWETDRIVINKLLSLGLPSGLQYVFEVGAFAVSTVMVGWLGAEALAAHNISINLAAITYMAATGIAAASTIRIGNQLKNNNPRNMRVAGYTSFGLVAVFMAVCGMLLVVYRGWLPSFYIDDASVKTIASRLLIIAAFFQISDGLQSVGLGVLRGLMDVKIPTIVTFIAYWVFAIPLGYLLGIYWEMGIQGIWYGLCGGLTLAAILHISRFIRLTR